MSRGGKFALSAVLVSVGLLVAAAVWFWGLRGDADAAAAPERQPCPTVEATYAALTNLFAGSSCARLEVRGWTCCELYNRLQREDAQALVWVFGEADWLVVRMAGKAALADWLERFAEFDLAGVESLADLFASYVGTVDEIRPAFAALDPDFAVAPQLFYTKELPPLKWLDREGVEADVLAVVEKRIGEVGRWRRRLLQGDMKAAAGNVEAAVDDWAAIFRGNAGDPLLVERLQRLELNAKVFVQVGNYPLAVHCYETILCIRPDDYVTLVNLGTCLERIDRKGDAAEIFRRAEALRRRGE